MYQEEVKSNSDASGVPDLYFFHYDQILISENTIREKQFEGFGFDKI